MGARDPRAARASRVASALAGAARLALGVLWILEGATKYRAGFGAADIRLVVSSAEQNPRVPGAFTAFAESVMAPLSGLFGVGIPLLEVALGALLVAGLATRLVAAAGAATLALYWLSDQLIWQYPAMAVLAVVVLLSGSAAGRWGADGWIGRIRRP
ncbi:DoxX family membrane protein [Microbacterium indicum]|uniref:DoxX family membrane protein n=1 Tax=Microbacterium indicum TaxID=358100 RepID=UPI000420B8A6|nr:DoxX family membrane protein [Microbacterium indicum]